MNLEFDKGWGIHFAWLWLGELLHSVKVSISFTKPNNSYTTPKRLFSHVLGRLTFLEFWLFNNFWDICCQIILLLILLGWPLFRSLGTRLTWSLLVLTYLIASIFLIIYAFFTGKFLSTKLLLILIVCSVSVDFRIGLRSILLRGGGKLNWDIVALFLNSYRDDILTLFVKLRYLATLFLGRLFLHQFILRKLG